MSAVRAAVRRFFEETAGALDCGAVAVACSGGADSLALAAATVHHAARAGGRPMVYGLVVDHGLQPASAEVAARAADQLLALGCAKAQVLAVRMAAAGNLEAAARAARYAALDAARPHPDALVLLGHTLDDQAETVLLGLGRGSGPRSLAGMRVLDRPWARPLLGVRRADTVAACAELGLTPWQDPHNADPRFRRARLRAEVLPLLDSVLRGGVAPALARTAAQLREDCDALDALAADLLAVATPPGDRGAGVAVLAAGATPPDAAGSPGLDAAALATAPAALRRRAVRRWLLEAGVTELTDAHLRAVDALVDPARWKGQGAVALPGHLDAARAAGRLLLRPRG